MTKYHERRVLFDDYNEAKLIVTVEAATLRDQFAMAALQGYCANIGMVGADSHVRAQYAYAQADDMLEARERSKP